MADAPHKTCCSCGQEKPRNEFHKNCHAPDGLRIQCKPCTRAINRKSVARHHEKRKAEKRAEYQRLKGDPRYKAYVAAYTAANKDRKREYDREYRERTKEKQAQWTKDWIKANPDKRRAISSNYKHRRRAQEAGGVSTTTLMAWTAAQKKVCYWCGCKCAKGFHVDHYVPLSKGGAHEVSNLVIACGPCNLRKNAKDPLDFAREVGRLL
jgi:5-methylcytosine-specific restriction endonuclease McrA